MNQNEIIEAVKGVKKGNSKSVTSLYEAFYKDVYYICFSMVKDEETAKDLTSDTFVTAFSKITQLKKDELFASWINSIANHTCLDYLKRKKIIEFSNIDDENITEIPDKTTASPEDAAVDREVVEILQTAISRLPEEQRICVFMFYYENYSVAEIAKEIGCSENTVRGRLRYANANLRKQIENLGNDGIKLRAIAALPFMYIVFKATYNNVYASAGEAGAQALLSKLANVTGGKAVKAASHAAGKAAKGKIIGICAGVAVCVAAGTIAIAANNKSGRKTATANPSQYESTKDEHKADGKITGAVLVEAGEGGTPHVYNDKFFVNAFGIDEISYKDAYGNLVYDNDKVDDIIWGVRYNNDNIDIFTYDNYAWVRIYEEGGTKKIFAVSGDGTVVLDEEVINDGVYSEWHIGENYVLMKKTDKADVVTLKGVNLKTGNVNYSTEVQIGEDEDRSNISGKYLVVCYTDDSGDRKQKVVNLENGKEFGSFDSDALIYGMEEGLAVFNREPGDDDYYYVSEYLAYDGDGNQIMSKKFTKEDEFKFLEKEGHRKYTVMLQSVDGNLKTSIVNIKLEPIAEYDGIVYMDEFYGGENRDVYAFYNYEFGVLIEGDEIKAEFDDSDYNDGYPYFTYWGKNGEEDCLKYVYYHSGAILDTYAVNAGTDYYLTEEDEYKIYDLNGKLVASLYKDGYNNTPALNEKGDKVVYKKGGNLLCYDVESGTEKVLCEAGDNVDLKLKMFRDKYALIFEEDEVETYHVSIVNIDDGTKINLFDTKCPVYGDMSDEMIAVTDRFFSTYEVYRIK